MQNKNILVVGAGSGIGAALIQRLSDKGYKNIYASSRSADKVKTCEGVIPVELELTEEQPSFPEIEGPLHALVYCPGTINLKPFKQLKFTEIENDMQVNVYGLIKTLQHYEHKLKDGNAGIVAFSTVAVGSGMPFHTSIAAAKGAVEGVVRSLAAEWAPQVRINAIAPSLTDTPLAVRLLRNDQQRSASEQRHPLKRIGNAEELAALAAFLISEEATWITGQVIHADGGMSSLRTS